MTRGSRPGLKLLGAFASLFRLCDALRFAELVDDEVALGSRHDDLDLLVLVSRGDHETVALPMCVVVLCDRQIEGLRAAILAALADDLDAILPSIPRLLTRLLDFAVHGPKHGFVSRDALVTGIHDYEDAPAGKVVHMAGCANPAARPGMRARQGDPALTPAARARVLFLPQSNPCRADPYTAAGALLSARGLER